MPLDLNCDLGEGEPSARTRALMRWVTSVNVACGGHAGTVRTMEACIRWAIEFGVRLGAHPGLPDRSGFGRAAVDLSSAELEVLLLQQVSALDLLARRRKTQLHHIKLHGALYHLVDASESLTRTYLRTVRHLWPGVKVYARAGGRVASEGPRFKVTVWPEGFVDRAYRDDGTLVPRGQPGAVIATPRAIRERLRALLDRAELVTASGRRLAWHPRTLCVHSDSPGAVNLVRGAARACGLRERGTG